MRTVRLIAYKYCSGSAFVLAFSSSSCFERYSMLDLKGNRITYFGHSTFSLTTPSGQVALIDPWVNTNPRCPETPKKLSRGDALFLTHAHSDQLGDLPAIASEFRPKLIANFE